MANLKVDDTETAFFFGRLPVSQKKTTAKKPKKKNNGGRPALGDAKRIQQSTTYAPDIHELIYKEINYYLKKGITYSFSDIVEKALRRRYAPELKKKGN